MKPSRALPSSPNSLKLSTPMHVLSGLLTSALRNENPFQTPTLTKAWSGSMSRTPRLMIAAMAKVDIRGIAHNLRRACARGRSATGRSVLGMSIAVPGTSSSRAGSRPSLATRKRPSRPNGAFGWRNLNEIPDT
jgi:hypothetical protein